MSYVELQVTTHFSFLRGASSAEELFSAAANLGIEALGIVDRNSLAGIVRAYEASRDTGVRLIVGCRLDLEDFPSLLVYPTDRAAYGRLCRLLTIGKARAGDMVHPYLRRREGKEAIEFPKPELEKVLGKTLGVPLFQEQAMQVAMVAAGFSANEADQLRRAMATFKFTGGVNKFRDKLIQA